MRVLVRNFARATRVARFPVELRGGDLTDPTAVQSAVEGCDYVFNCAYGNSGTPAQQRAVNVDGLENVLSAAARTGVQRVVHVSTVAVYGAPSTELLTEDSERPPGGDPYASSKLESEEVAARHAARGVPVTVVQPTCVYGPFSPSWTIRILGDLKARRVLLVDDGSGLCNPVHVDDVVEAMLHAALAPGAVGETFLVSGPEPVTWKRFYGAHEDMLGFRSTLSLSMAEAEARWNERLARKSLLRESLGVLRSDGTARSRVRNSREIDLLRRAARRLVPASLRKSFKARLKGPGTAPPAEEQDARPLMLMPPPPWPSRPPARGSARPRPSASWAGSRPSTSSAACARPRPGRAGPRTSGPLTGVPSMPTSAPRVTIVVPCYNHAHFLRGVPEEPGRPGGPALGGDRRRRRFPRRGRDRPGGRAPGRRARPDPAPCGEQGARRLSQQRLLGSPAPTWC